MSEAELNEVLNYISNIQAQKDETIVEAKQCTSNLRKARKEYEELLSMEFQLEMNEEFFKYYWSSFHSLVNGISTGNERRVLQILLVFIP